MISFLFFISTNLISIDLVLFGPEMSKEDFIHDRSLGYFESSEHSLGVVTHTRIPADLFESGRTTIREAHSIIVTEAPNDLREIRGSGIYKLIGGKQTRVATAKTMDSDLGSIDALSLDHPLAQWAPGRNPNRFSEHFRQVPTHKLSLRRNVLSQGASLYSVPPGLFSPAIIRPVIREDQGLNDQGRSELVTVTVLDRTYDASGNLSDIRASLFRVYRLIDGSVSPADYTETDSSFYGHRRIVESQPLTQWRSGDSLLERIDVCRGAVSALLNIHEAPYRQH